MRVWSESRRLTAAAASVESQQMRPSILRRRTVVVMALSFSLLCVLRTAAARSPASSARRLRGSIPHAQLLKPHSLGVPSTRIASRQLEPRSCVPTRRRARETSQTGQCSRRGYVAPLPQGTRARSGSKAFRGMPGGVKATAATKRAS